MIQKWSLSVVCFKTKRMINLNMPLKLKIFSNHWNTFVDRSYTFRYNFVLFYPAEMTWIVDLDAVRIALFQWHLIQKVITLIYMKDKRIHKLQSSNIPHNLFCMNDINICDMDHFIFSTKDIKQYICKSTIRDKNKKTVIINKAIQLNINKWVHVA